MVSETTFIAGVKMYGERFLSYTPAMEIRDIVALFKDFYCSAKLKNPQESVSVIVRKFQVEVCDPMQRVFMPNIARLYKWREKWDLEMKYLGWREKREIQTGLEEVKKIVKMTEKDKEDVAPSDESIEGGARTLAGELLNDAMRMLRSDQNVEEAYTTDELMKRRGYVVNVLAHATRLAHGKASLKLQASKEKRDTAGFLMDLMAQATSGKMTDEEMTLLKGAYAPATHD